MNSTASHSKLKKKRPKEHFNDLQVSNFVQARMWCVFIQGWQLITLLVMLIFAFVSGKDITTAQTVFFIVKIMLLFMGFGSNYMSFKYEDYKKVDMALVMTSAYSLVWILSMKFTEDSESALSPEMSNIALLVNGNVVMITTIFVNTVCQKMKLMMVSGQVILLYAFALIHQYGFSGISSDTLTAGYDAQGVFLLLLVVLLVIVKIVYFVKKNVMEESAIK